MNSLAQYLAEYMGPMLVISGNKVFVIIILYPHLIQN